MTLFLLSQPGGVLSMNSLLGSYHCILIRFNSGLWLGYFRHFLLVFFSLTQKLGCCFVGIIVLLYNSSVFEVACWLQDILQDFLLQSRIHHGFSHPGAETATQPQTVKLLPLCLMKDVIFWNAVRFIQGITLFITIIDFRVYSSEPLGFTTWLFSTYKAPLPFFLSVSKSQVQSASIWIRGHC